MKYLNLSFAQGALSLIPADVESDCQGKHAIKVLMTPTGSRDLRPKGTSSKLFVFALLPLKSDHSLSSSDGFPSSLPAMLCFKKIVRVRLAPTETVLPIILCQMKEFNMAAVPVLNLVTMSWRFTRWWDFFLKHWRSEGTEVSHLDFKYLLLV